MSLILTILLIAVLLVGSEAWWRIRKPHDEFSRKFIHIAVGSLAAFFPYFLTTKEIIFLSAAFIAVVAVSKYAHIFQAIHAVERPTWGEIFFAVAVGLVALIAHEPLIYTIALLHMSLADGLAAIAGVTWGKTNRYRIFGHIKSITGSAAFFVVSVALLAAYSHIALQPIGVAQIVAIAAVATCVENLGVLGIDNLIVPVFVAAVLAWL